MIITTITTTTINSITITTIIITNPSYSNRDSEKYELGSIAPESGSKDPTGGQASNLKIGNLL